MKMNSFLRSIETAGIYESLGAYEGVIFRPEDHLERFFESAKTAEKGRSTRTLKF